MKSTAAIETQIKKLQDALAKAKTREREQRIARLLSAMDSAGLTDDEAVAAIQAAGETKNGGGEQQ